MLVIDTDGGVDDCMALIIAMHHMEIDAITTVAGNVDVELATRNVLLVQDLCGNHCPVYEGAKVPLLDKYKHSRWEGHGTDGIGGYSSKLPTPLNSAQTEHAAVALIKYSFSNPTIICLGPLTNIALAMRLDPGFASRIQKLIIMGGSVHAKGNTSRTSEFNFLYDPEAAHIVFSSAVDQIMLVPWETCLDHGLDWEWLENLPETKYSLFLKNISTIYQDLRNVLPLEQYVMPDIYPICALIDPDSIQEIEKVHVMIELHGEFSRGMVAIDWFKQQEPNCTVIKKFSNERVYKILSLFNQ